MLPSDRFRQQMFIEDPYARMANMPWMGQTIDLPQAPQQPRRMAPPPAPPRPAPRPRGDGLGPRPQTTTPRNTTDMELKTGAGAAPPMLPMPNVTAPSAPSGDGGPPIPNEPMRVTDPIEAQAGNNSGGAGFNELRGLGGRNIGTRIGRGPSALASAGKVY